MDLNLNITIVNVTQNVTGHGKSNTLAIINQSVVTSTLILLMVGMGCTMTLKEVKKNLRRPIPIIIGACCQFVLMPFLGWSLSHIFQLSPELALGTLAIATCPGGAFSNMLTYWTRGDTCLSICMTTCSTLIGIGMMPLNLYVYSRSWSDAATIIPYVDIVVALIIMVFPCSIGMVILWKWPKVATYIAKVTSLISMAGIAVVMALTTVFNPSIFTTWKSYAIVCVYPITAFACGYLISFICRQSHARCRTIAFETGVQNGALALTIINLMFTREGADVQHIFMMMTIPMLQTFSVVFQFLLVMFGYRMYFRRQDKKKKEKNNLQAILAEWNVDGFPKYVEGKSEPKTLCDDSDLSLYKQQENKQQRDDERWKQALFYANAVSRDRDRRQVHQDIQTDTDGLHSRVRSGSRSSDTSSLSPIILSFEGDRYPTIANGTLPFSNGYYNPAFTPDVIVTGISTETSV